jgi:hypothetical protein
MDIKTKIKTFAATVAMGAITHLVTTQSAVIQQKLGLSSDPQKLGVQLAEKVLQGDYTKLANKSVDKLINTGVAVAAEVPVAKTRAPASVPKESPKLSKLDKKLCDFKSSYISKDQEAIKKNYRSIQEIHFKNKKVTEKGANEFVAQLEGYLVSGKYNDKKIICPK